MTQRADAPSNLRSLEKRIDNVARSGERPVRRIRRAVANTVVGQLLPPGVVKGGTAMKLRVGEAGSRFTPDLDAAMRAGIGLDRYLDELSDRLAEGWGSFTGTLSVLDPPQPDGVPEEYVMQPFRIALAYRARHWLTVPFELGHDEIGSTLNPEWRIAKDIVDLFGTLGLPTPDPIPVQAVEHQIAQKLHACTNIRSRTGGNQRAHDLVDIQILMQEESVDLQQVRDVAARLFRARQSHPWPPTVVAHERWETIYAEAAAGLEVIDNVDDAVAWTNDLIARAQ